MIIEQPYFSRGIQLGYLMKLAPENGVYSGKFMPLEVYNERLKQEEKQVSGILPVEKIIPETSEMQFRRSRGRPRVS